MTNRNMKTRCLSLSIACVLMPLETIQAEESVPEDLIGDWTLYLSTEEPAWLKVEEVNGDPVVNMRVHVQSAGPHKITAFEIGR